MAMGMSYAEFWHGDYTQWKFWEEEHLLRKERENEKLWLQGAYFYVAFSTALSNAFLEKGQTPHSYPEEPWRITPMTEEEKLKKEEADKKKMVEEFRAALNAMGSRFTAKHERERAMEHAQEK
jgi:hypothetical protein